MPFRSPFQGSRARVLRGPPLRRRSSREPVLATAVDGSGERAIFLPLKASRGFDLHLAVLSDEKGVLSLTSRQLSRRQLHAFIAELAPDTREMLREISLERARALLAAAVDLNPGGAMGTAEAAGIHELLRSLPRAEKHEPATVESAGSTDASPALRDSLALFDAPAMRSYLPPQDVILAVGQKLEEVMLSPLLVDETQRLAQMRHALERAANDYFTSQRRSARTRPGCATRRSTFSTAAIASTPIARGQSQRRSRATGRSTRSHSRAGCSSGSSISKRPRKRRAPDPPNTCRSLRRSCARACRRAPAA